MPPSKLATRFVLFMWLNYWKPQTLLFF